MASISSVITGGFGTPGSASLVITDGYGTAGVTPPPPVVSVNAGPGGRLFSSKRKNKVIRFSDFESREAYAQALQAAIPMSQVKPIETIERTVDDDDDDVVFMIMRMLH